MQPTLRLLLLVFLAVCLLTGCGVKSAYNNADWLVMRWIDDRVSLNAEQERAVEAALERELAWHCASELPAYAEFLQEVRSDIAADRITTATLENHGERASDFGLRLLSRVRPTLIDLLASLDDDQVDQLMESFEERNRELAEEAERSDKELQRERAKGMEKGMRRFTGRLTSEQRDMLSDWAAKLEPTAEIALERRLAWQAEFEQALSIRHDRQAFETAAMRLLDPAALQSDAYRSRVQTHRERTLETLVDIHHSAPERQIERAGKRLTGLAEDLKQIGCG
ncbi:DUF6279 family lipoprotein [Wenzhouxiangella sp. EGI_FJ10409]|uniref:DUF6279 family lipoprotein n=1 Tax=Wenzhouxiangella sp. EGI_FJ10409 TaxID=3243767 RepID=UPI0035DC9AD0